MNRQILLVEPAYRSKYPPLGLMKIAQYHKLQGDHVEFIKGLSVKKRDKFIWDRIYVASLFTYNWSHTIKALKYYKNSVRQPISKNLIVGGVMATLMSQDIKDAIGCRVVSGLLDKKGKLGYEDDDCIDTLVPDYDILKESNYKYPVSNAYVVYATRGCKRKCKFCAVPIIEPKFKHYVPIASQIQEIDRKYDPKRDLILLDNNVLASEHFEKIIEEIKSAGFAKGAFFAYKGKLGQEIRVRRRVDFNQGVDIRRLSSDKMALLSQIAIDPLRLAFDNIKVKNIYEKKIRLAVKFGIRRLSNYILFNYKDTPEDLYERLRLNIQLNQELDLQIFSFPMRYVSLKSKDRLTDTVSNIGRNWNRKYLRAIRCILIPTRGVVGTHMDYFEAAFGKDLEEFHKILLMPESYIINRLTHNSDGSTELWWNQLDALNSAERYEVLNRVLHTDLRRANLSGLSKSVASVLNHYVEIPESQLSLDYLGNVPAQVTSSNTLTTVKF